MNKILKLFLAFIIFFIASDQVHAEKRCKKRLLMISDIYENAIGGTEEVFAQIKSRLQARNFEVHIMDLSAVDTFEMPLLGEKLPCLWGIKDNVARVIKTFQPDYVFIGLLGPLSIKAGYYCLENNIPYTVFCTVRMPDLAQHLLDLPFDLMKKFSHYLIDDLLTGAATVLVPTTSFKRELREQGVEHVVEWAHGINLEKFTLPTKEEKEHAIKVCGLENKTHPFYLYVGHISLIKNMQALFDVRVPGTKIVVGDQSIGYNLDELKTQYPGIVFTGPKRGNDLLNYYTCADIFLFPSKNDTFGLVLLEALASGLPIVGFNTYGPGDVTPVGCGVSYLANSDQELGACAVKAWQDLQEGNVTSKQCRDYASRFSWDEAIDKLVLNLTPVTALPGDEDESCC